MSRLTPVIRLLFFTFLLAATLAQADSPSIKPFTSDGCSLFPDGTLKHKQLWLDCCTQHDKAYWAGGTYQQRQQADTALKQCVTQVGEPHIAQLMLAGVRVGGSPYWPTQFRWGYGWPFGRGYQALTDDEHQAVEQQWQQYLDAQVSND